MNCNHKALFIMFLAVFASCRTEPEIASGSDKSRMNLSASGLDISLPDSPIIEQPPEINITSANDRSCTSDPIFYSVTTPTLIIKRNTKTGRYDEWELGRYKTKAEIKEAMKRLLLIAPVHPMRICIDDPYNDMPVSDLFSLIQELRDLKWFRIKIGYIEGYIIHADDNDNVRELEPIPPPGQDK